MPAGTVEFTITSQDAAGNVTGLFLGTPEITGTATATTFQITITTPERSTTFPVTIVGTYTAHTLTGVATDVTGQSTTVNDTR